MTSNLPASVLNHHDFQSAVHLVREIEPGDEIDYGWVCEHAALVWQDCDKSWNDLDAKADGIIRYIGGGTGLFTLGVLASVNPNNVLLIVWAIPAVICGLASILFASMARKPSWRPSPPEITEAINYVHDTEKDQPQARFLSQWHMACVAMRIVSNKKATLIEVSTWLYLAAIALLLLPVLVAIVQMM